MRLDHIGCDQDCAGFDAFLGNGQLFTDLDVISIANHVVLERRHMMRLLG